MLVNGENRAAQSTAKLVRKIAILENKVNELEQLVNKPIQKQPSKKQAVK